MALRIKSGPQDLHVAAKSLRRAVGKVLKLRRIGSPEYESTHVRRRCFMRCVCAGPASKLAPVLQTRDFQFEEGLVADERVMRATKSFMYQGYTYTARVVVYPAMHRLTLSVQVQLPSFS